MDRPHVLILATDFSTSSEQALARAIDIAQRFESSLHIAHAFTLPAPMFTPYDMALPEPYMNEAREAARRQLESVKQKAADAGVQAECHLLSGAVADAISDLACELEADWIVVGTRGNTGIKHALLGSAAERIVRHAPCSVLVVRERGGSAGDS